MRGLKKRPQISDNKCSKHEAIAVPDGEPNAKRTRPASPAKLSMPEITKTEDNKPASLNVEEKKPVQLPREALAAVRAKRYNFDQLRHDRRQTFLRSKLLKSKRCSSGLRK